MRSIKAASLLVGALLLAGCAGAAPSLDPTPQTTPSPEISAPAEIEVSAPPSVEGHWRSTWTVVAFEDFDETLGDERSGYVFFGEAVASGDSWQVQEAAQPTPFAADFDPSTVENPHYVSYDGSRITWISEGGVVDECLDSSSNAVDGEVLADVTVVDFAVSKVVDDRVVELTGTIIGKWVPTVAAGAEFTCFADFPVMATTFDVVLTRMDD